MGSHGDAIANPLRWSLAARIAPVEPCGGRVEFGVQSSFGHGLWRATGEATPLRPAPIIGRKRVRIGSAVAQLLHATTRAFGAHAVDRNNLVGLFSRVRLPDPHGGDLLQELLDSVAAEMALLDEDGAIIAVNIAWCAAMVDPRPGARRGGVGLAYLDLCRELSGELDVDALQKGLDELADGRRHEFATPLLETTRQGRRWRRLRVTALSPGALAAFVVIHEDIVDAAPTALCDTPEGRLVVQEEERQRLAIELHDSTCQHLAALGLGVARLRRLVGGHDDGAEDVLEDMSKSVGEVVKEIRVLSYLTKPPGLERDGLEESVRGFIQGFGARTGLSASLRIEGPVDDAGAAVQHAAFRIIQEAASNVYRHAQATHIDVRLSSLGGVLTVRVADNGKGIAELKDGEDGRVLSGVGVAGMQTRVAKLNGRLEIACPDKGTVVAATLPLHANPAFWGGA